VKFQGTLHLNGKTATGIRVPPEVVAALGDSKRPAVRVTIHGYTYRSTIAPMGGEFWIPVSAENRNGAGVTAGDQVEVDVELDTAPRQVDVPSDFAEALATAPDARRFFDGLSYSQQRWFVLNIEGAKKPETRARRVAEAVQRLSEGRGQR
jgi:hypothetical protein